MICDYRSEEEISEKIVFSFINKAKNLFPKIPILLNIYRKQIFSCIYVLQWLVSHSRGPSSSGGLHCLIS